MTNFQILKGAIRRAIKAIRDLTSVFNLQRTHLDFEWKLSDGTIYVEKNISHIRKLSYDIIISEYFKLKNKRVLEIGPRYSRFILRKQLELNRCEYFSISGEQKEFERGNTKIAEKLPIKVFGNYKGYVSQLAELFKKNYFDFIIGTQCFEHWREEDPCENIGLNAYKIGLENCHKILKKGGWFIQDFPIGLHGDKLFISGDWKRIKKLFDNRKWTNVSLLERGKDFAIKKNLKVWAGIIRAMKK
jgi:SAM-dependent methyltransferase